MPTLLFSPSVQVLIETVGHGVLDVSDDITRMSTTMTENDIGSLRLSLANHRRKYDRVFTPNDRFVVRMKRIGWVQVMAGYLDEVPYFSIFPKEVTIAGSCSLKRLLYRPWDPGTSAAVSLLNSTSSIRDVDGGVRDKMFRLLTEVAEWPAANIHIGALPSGWFSRAQQIADALAARVTLSLDDLGLGATSGGTGGSSVVTTGTLTVPGSGRFTGVLPNTSGKISSFGGPNGGAYGRFALTGESGVTPSDPWYCAMRWPYAAMSGNRVSTLGSATEVANAKAWWRNRKILAVHTTTGKAVVMRAADWGPAVATGRVLDISPTAMRALGGKTDDTVEIRFAAENAALGPVTQSTVGGSGFLNPGANLGGTPAATSVTQSGLSFTPRDSLKGNVAAARDFIRQTWEQARKNSIGGYQYRTIAGSQKMSDHAYGLALDVGNGSGNNKATAEQRAYSTSVAAWFVSNPEVFGVKYVIWDNKIIYGDGKGWRQYAGGRYAGNMSLGHFNHVHISFHDTKQTSPGPMGRAWVGADMAGFPSFTAADGSVGGGSSSGSLINAWNWTQQPDVLSETLFGPRALMNDESIYQSIKGLATASMRSMMSAPNGDLIAWFPDYFGTYKTAGIMNIQDIELIGDGFNVQWSDSRLKTHIFATASSTGVGAMGGAVDSVSKMVTSGIASVEYPEIMAGLFNMNSDRLSGTVFADAETILQRFGARPESTTIGTLTGAQSEFWYALTLFQRNWVQQFSSRISVSFMPEIFPGMLVRLPSYKFQAYVTSVTHNIDFDGGGFTTDVSIIAPSSTDGSGLIGLGR